MSKYQRYGNLLDRVNANIEINENGCWVWQGSTSGEGRGGGYGRISINGHTCAVHRVVATAYFGYIPRKMTVDHVCNNRLCCNPDHLEVVSNLENQRRKRIQREQSLAKKG